MHFSLRQSLYREGLPRFPVPGSPSRSSFLARLVTDSTESRMRYVLQLDASATTRSRAYRVHFLSAMLGSLFFLGLVGSTLSLSSAERQLADDWVEATVRTSFAGEAKQLAAYRKLQGEREEKKDERAETRLADKFAETFTEQLTEEILTRLREDRDPESIFEFENDAYKCGPSEVGGSIYDPSSYTCSATCQLVNGDPSTPIGIFHEEIVDNLLPTLHAVRSLKVAMTGRNNAGELAEDPIGGIAFVVNLLHEAENPVCLLAGSEVLETVTGLFENLEKLAKLLLKVNVPQIKFIGKLLTRPVKNINGILEDTNDFLGEACEQSTQLHILTLATLSVVTRTLTSLDQFTAMMLAPLAEATCVSDNTFTLADELTAAIDARAAILDENDEDAAEDPADPGARRLKEYTFGSRAPVHLPMTGNLSVHDRRHLAAALTPHAQSLPIRRALMYSDWEQRSTSEAGGVAEGLDADGEGNRKLGLREPLSSLTIDITNGSVAVMSVFLSLFKVLDRVFRTFGTLWVRVASVLEGFHDAVETLFDALAPFLKLFDILFKIGDILQFFTCPSFLNFVCLIEELISKAVEVLFTPFENIFEPLLERLIEVINLPSIGFNIADILPKLLAGVEPIGVIRGTALSLVQDVVEVFIDDPLPALFEMNPADTTGLDVLYSGARVDTTVGIEDCTDTYGEKRLPILFNGIQRSAFCPRGTDFTAASLFPCGGLGEIDLVTGDDCVVSSDAKVPLVCVNDNYPPEFLNEDGSVNFPDFLPPRSDFILQAHYACARESTVFELALLPAESIAFQGNGELKCSLGRYAVDFAEIGIPCRDDVFVKDPSGDTGYKNNEACTDIDEDRSAADNFEFISELVPYLDLVNAQKIAHNACNGDHMCLVGVWVSANTITELLTPLVPPELENFVDSMVAQHLDLYDWGTSNPIYETLASGFDETRADFRGFDVRESTPADDATVAGVFDRDNTDERLLTTITCGEGSYLEQLLWTKFARRRKSGRAQEDIAEMRFRCYGDRAAGTTPTSTGRHFIRDGDEYIRRRTTNMNCIGERGGFEFFALFNRRGNGNDKDDWRWQWKCMDGTVGDDGGTLFTITDERLATCGGATPVQSFEHFWGREKEPRKFLAADESNFNERVVVRVNCGEGGSPLERARNMSLSGFEPNTNVGRYVARRDAKIAEYEPQVPVCERIALENAANCNALPLEQSVGVCILPPECDSAGVRHYCPVPGIDTELPEPERVANAFGDDNLKDAVVECPEGMVYSALEVTQGVPPFGGVNGFDDFVAAGCDGTTSSCVYPSPEGQSARIVFQCLCGEGFRPLTNEEGGCDLCPLGTDRTFVEPDDGSGLVLADSCLSCQSGFFGDVESETSPVPTCHLCPKNTYSDKIGAVGVDICIPCEAGRFTEADGGSTSVEQCVACGVDFECPGGGERTACPVGFWTNGKTDSSACVSCPPGTFYPTDGGTDSTCTPCPPGTFSDEFGQLECTPCPVGTFGRDSGADTCEVCPQSTFQDQEGADVCQQCDGAKPYTSSVQTTSAAGCWDEDFRSAVDMVVLGTATVEMDGGNGTTTTSAVEDPQAALGVLEAGLLAWADDWAATVLPGDKVTIDTEATTVAQGGFEGQFVLSFKADAENVLVTEAKELVHMVAYPEVVTDMVTTIAQVVRDDADTSLVMSPVPEDVSFEASVVASRDLILPLALIDFENAELADLTCPQLLERFTPNLANAILEVGDGFCNGGPWNTPQCNFDGGDCCASTCTPVSLAELASNRATTADDCISEEVGDGFCDVEFNSEICGFDGGDCCSTTCVPGAGGECLEGTFDCRDGSEPPEDTEPRAQSCGSRTMQCLDPAAVEEAPAGCADVRRARALRLDDSEPEHELLPLANKATWRRRLQEEAPPAEEDCGSSVIQWGDGVCDARLNTELCNFDGGDCCAQTCVQSPIYPDSCLYFDCVDPEIGADEPVAVYDGEVPALKNLPIQNLNVTVSECIAPTTQLVISADNDPCFEGGIVVPTDEVAGADNCSFTVTRTWAAEDLSSNSVQAQRTYQVADTKPPFLTGLPAEGLVIQTDDPNFSFVGDDTAVVAVDACSGLEVPVVYTESPVLGELDDECIRTFARTWTAEDECGNSVSATRTTTVEISAEDCTIGASPSPSSLSFAPTSFGDTFAPSLGTIAPTSTLSPALEPAPSAALDTIAPTATLPPLTPAPSALDTTAPTSTLSPASTSAPAVLDTNAPAVEIETIAPTTPSPTVAEEEETPSPTVAEEEATPSPTVAEEEEATPSPTVTEEEEATPSPTTVADPTTPSPSTVAV